MSATATKTSTNGNGNGRLPANSSQMHAGPDDTFRHLGVNTYREAYKRGMSLSVYLEAQDPSEGYKDGLDAFSRLVKAAGIKTRSYPALGVWADQFEVFNESEQHRALWPEFLSRRWREAAYGMPVSTRAAYLSDDAPINTFENPYIDAGVLRYSRQIGAAIPLSEVVAITTPVSGDSYRMTYLDFQESDLRLVRVGEAAEIPTVKLQTSRKTVDLYKFGRALEASYEVLRRQRIDRISLHIQLMAVQAEADKLAAIVDILVNGDGTPGSGAQNHDLTALDPGTTANNMTLRAWLAFKMKFANPYVLTTVLSQEGPALDLQLLNTGDGNIPLVTIQAAAGFGSFRPINSGLRDAVALGWTAEAPADKIVGFDRRFAVERVVETGADISEVERHIKSQTEILTLTEVEGYGKIDNNAVKVLNLAA